MNAWDLYVHIGRVPRKAGALELTVRFSPEEHPAFEVKKQLLELEQADIGTAISAAIRFLSAQERGRNGVSNDFEPSSLMLDIGVPELYGLEWERILAGIAVFDIVRYRPVSDELSLIPFELPARLLHVYSSSGAPAGPSDSVLRYFRTQSLRGFAATELPRTMQAGHFDIVHIHCAATPSGIDTSFREDRSYQPRDALENGALRRSLRACSARLLILECVVPDFYEQMLMVAHQLLRYGGPSIYVLGDAAPSLVDALYMNIVHDQPFSRSPLVGYDSPAKVALFVNAGGQTALSISPGANRLMAGVQRNVDAVDFLTSQFSAIAPAELGVTPVSRQLGQLGFEQRQLSQRVYNFNRESGAWLPLADDSRQHADAARVLEGIRRANTRVANVGLFDESEKRALEISEPLRPGRTYALSFQIGRRQPWSIVGAGAEFPEWALPHPPPSEPDASLRVVIFAADFRIEQGEQQLAVAPPPAASSVLIFRIRAPEMEGAYRIRVCVYYEQNLLQSILVRANVAAELAPVSQGTAMLRTEVEFSLSTELANVQRFPSRTVNLLTNATDSGSHTLAIVGKTLKTSFDFGEGEMRSAIDAARETLSNIAADLTSKTPVYRFDVNNRTTVERFAQDAIELAQLGYELYSNIVTGKDQQFAKDLKAQLGVSGAKIQVAAMKSARYVFPWALVYDHPLVRGKLSLCEDFAASLKNGQPLGQQTCLVNGCRNTGKFSVVCPSGFWGFKHLIEQPLSVDADTGTPRELVLEIDGGPPTEHMPALMVVSRKLSQVAVHETELRASHDFQYQVLDVKNDVGLNMTHIPFGTNIYYFYCHGGRKKDLTWLGIGLQDQLFPSDLNGWQCEWVDKHPLIFINGCHTVDITPDDLLSFNQTFAYCRAAGVIGTEISIPEGLARAFARGFLSQFAAGTTVGESFRQQRLDLLQGCNLLGLAYTPYCSSDLRVVRH